jgi:hypothetical protein
MQQRWVDRTEVKKTTGILLWDLTAAYDTLDKELLSEKLKIYGFYEQTRKWFRSFLTGRTQRVGIIAEMSEAIKLKTGVSQGSILSPVLFIVFVSDMEDWTEHSGIFTYADNTSTDTSSRDVNQVIRRLEKYLEGILQYMATNGLVANPQKTVFMLVGREREERTQVKVGNIQITQSATAKLLRVEIDEKQKFKLQDEKLVKT